MHIEIGIIEPVRVAAAGVGASALVAAQLPALVRDPFLIAKTVLAAATFSLLMEVWHLPVGPSELHLIGATTVYLLFGFVPTLLGFGLGLLLQAVLFEPLDLAHLGVNALSLMVPLLAVHYSYGRRLTDLGRRERFSYAKVLRLDAVFYGGVTAMVGFWLLASTDPAPLADFARWAAAYLPVFLGEATLTFATVTLIARWRDAAWVARATNVGRLSFA